MIKLQIPRYRFHYYARDNKNGDQKQHVEYNNGENVHESDSNGTVQTVNYSTDNSSGLQTDIYTNASASLFKLLLNNSIHSNQQINNSENSTMLPIYVNPKNTEQKSVDSRDHLVESVDNITQLNEQITTYQPEDRLYDAKDEQVTDQTLFQNDHVTNKEFDITTIPFEKLSPINADDLKYFDDEVLKQSIIKVLQDIKDREQSDPKLHLMSSFYTKLLKVTDAMKTKSEKSCEPLSNKPLRLLGYNPETVGSLYNMKVHYNQASQTQQPHFPEFDNRDHNDNVKQPQIYASSTIQPISNQENQKFMAPLTHTQQIYYYDPNTRVMFPIPNHIIKNTYPFVENKPLQTLPTPAEPRNRFSFMNFFRRSGKRSQQMNDSHSIVSFHPQTKVDYKTSNKTPTDQNQQLHVDCNNKKPYMAPTLNPGTSVQTIPLCADCVPNMGYLSYQAIAV